MNEEFEQLPFDMGQEWESGFADESGFDNESGRDDGFEMEDESARWPSRPASIMRGGGRPSRPPRAMARPAPPRKGPPRHRAGRRPFFGPPALYGGWPYGVAYPLVEPFPYAAARSAPQPEPEPEPEPTEDQDQNQDQPDEEATPAILGDTLSRMPPAQRPDYQPLGSIVNALAEPQGKKNPQLDGPGLYLIEFTSNGKARAYSGQTGDLRRRLQQHALCGRMMGLPLDGHQVHVARLPALASGQRRALEQRINRDMLVRHKGVLTNQRQELEMRLLGSDWG